MVWPSIAWTALEDLDYNIVYFFLNERNSKSLRIKIHILPTNKAHTICLLGWGKCNMRFDCMLQHAWWFAWASIIFSYFVQPLIWMHASHGLKTIAGQHIGPSAHAIYM